MQYFSFGISCTECPIHDSATNEKDKDILTRFSMAEVLGSHHGDPSVHGLKCSGNIHWNLPVEDLVEMAVSRRRSLQRPQSFGDRNR